VKVRSDLAGLTTERAERVLDGLPRATGYLVVVKPLRYRERPHLSAWTSFEDHEIVLQVPEPFFPFGEVVPYAARRRPGKGIRFIWLTEGVTFSNRAQVLRFLYLHECGCTGTCVSDSGRSRRPRPRAIASRCGTTGGGS